MLQNFMAWQKKIKNNELLFLKMSTRFAILMMILKPPAPK